MQVKDAMTDVVLTVGPAHTLCDVAKQMDKRQVGAAIIMDPDSAGPGIITERDIITSVARGEDPATSTVGDHSGGELISAAPDWGLERAAETMVRHNFRHLIVVDGSKLVGIISMRDIVRTWVRAGVIAAQTG